MTQADPMFDETASPPSGLRIRFRRLTPACSTVTRVRELLAIALAIVAPMVSGYDTERARAYFARELAECGAWYTLVAEAPGLDATTQIRFRAVGISLVSTAADLATERWAMTQMELATATIRREMRNSWSNYAAVDKKYGQRCRDVATDPAARRKYWLDKHD